MSIQHDTQNQARTDKSEDPLLYHYTNLEAFRSIVENGELWATHIRYLNDASEQRLMWDLLRERIEAQLKGASAAEYEKLTRLKTVATSPQDDDMYVISFCKDGGDRLSQWRGYGANAGVAIGFSPDPLTDICKATTTLGTRPRPTAGAAHLIEVKYKDSSADEDWAKLIEGSLEFSRNLPTSDTTKQEEAFTHMVSYYAASLKHTAFYEEQEWRIILFNWQQVLPAQFRTRRSMLIPYTPLKLGSHLSHLIRRVVVGPNPHSKETVAAVKKLLASKEAPNTDVIETQIPYRDW